MLMSFTLGLLSMPGRYTLFIYGKNSVLCPIHRTAYSSFNSFQPYPLPIVPDSEQQDAET